MATTAVEKSKTRADLAQLAGRGPFSALSMMAGVLVGYAAFSFLLAGAVAVLRSRGSELDLSESWTDLSNRGGLLLGGLLFLSYLLAGYIAGRMAWRRGAAHGLLVFLGSILVVGVAAALLRTFTQPEDVEGITDALNSFGIPTTAGDWSNLGPVVWVASLGGMLLGSVLGGLLGERWFTKVSRRALGAEIDLRERLETSHERPASAPETRHGPVTGGGNGEGTGNGTVRSETLDLDAMTRDELYHRAQEADIPGRSQMTKDQLADALQKQGARPEG